MHYVLGERYKEAINIMNEALKYHPNNFDIYYNIHTEDDKILKMDRSYKDF